jgi:hypothetical protein
MVSKRLSLGKAAALNALNEARRRPNDAMCDPRQLRRDSTPGPERRRHLRRSRWQRPDDAPARWPTTPSLSATHIKIQPTTPRRGSATSERRHDKQFDNRRIVFATPTNGTKIHALRHYGLKYARQGPNDKTLRISEFGMVPGLYVIADKVVPGAFESTGYTYRIGEGRGMEGRASLPRSRGIPHSAWNRRRGIAQRRSGQGQAGRITRWERWMSVRVS